MLLHKTALAHSALQAGARAGLGLVERRILIVTDGKRTLNEVMAMLGADILPAIDRLLKDGYIRAGDARATPPAAPATGVASAFTGLLRATTDVLQARTEQIRAAGTRPAVAAQVQPAAPGLASLPPQPAAARGPRRSLVAAKMYMVDMLSLQRDPDAVEHKARIQCCGDDGDLVQAILDGAQVLLQLTNDSFGQRVLARLAEVLPEPQLPALEAIRMQRVMRDATPQLKIVAG